MTIAIDNKTSYHGNTQNFTIAGFTVAGDNRVLYVLAGAKYRNDISGITYGGDALTMIGRTTDYTRCQVDVWRLINPQVGAHDVVVTMTTSRHIVAEALSLTGVDQTTPERTPIVHDPTVQGSPAINVVSAADELVIDVVAGENDSPGTGTLVVGAGQTEDLNETDTSTTGVIVGSSHEAGAASVDMTWTYNPVGTGYWAGIAFSVKPSAGSGTTPVQKAVSVSYSIRAIVTKTRQSTYTIKNRLTKALAVAYGIALSAGLRLDSFGSGGSTPTSPVTPSAYEYDFSDVEHSFIESQPPNLLPENQDSNFGQIRKVIADVLQETVDQINIFENEIFLGTTTRYLSLREELLGLPINPSGISIEQRRARLLSRLRFGAFTRTARREAVEAFIKAVIGGAAVQLWWDGIALSDAGISLGTDVYSLEGTYSITEDIENFSYTVNVKDTLGVDVVGLERELTRLTPAGISFTVNEVANP